MGGWRVEDALRAPISCLLYTLNVCCRTRYEKQMAAHNLSRRVIAFGHLCIPPCSGRAIKTVHEAGSGFKLESDAVAANGLH
jgi:hypothetical protein